MAGHFSQNALYYDSERKVSLGGRSHIITVELNKLETIVEKPVEKMTTQERWSVFFRYSTDTAKRQKINQIVEVEETIAMACEVLRTVSRDKVERARLMSEYKYAVDLQSQRVQAKRLGLKEGRIEGRTEGLKEGRTEGRMEVIELLESGKSLDEIKRLYNEQQ